MGMLGVKSFAAIVNPPQAAILAVGAARAELLPSPSSSAHGFEAATLMCATLSCDHRVVDGAAGAAWLAAFRRFMEQPVSMLL